MTFESDVKISPSLIQGIRQFEGAHGDDYLNKDGSINEVGLKELRYLQVKQSSYNDLKWDNFAYFHLKNRTKIRWRQLLKKEHVYMNEDYFNTWCLIKNLKQNIIHDFTHKKCKKCKGHGWINKVNVYPNKKCKACKGKGEIKK